MSPSGENVKWCKAASAEHLLQARTSQLKPVLRCCATRQGTGPDHAVSAAGIVCVTVFALLKLIASSKSVSKVCCWVGDHHDPMWHCTIQVYRKMANNGAMVHGKRKAELESESAPAPGAAAPAKAARRIIATPARAVLGLFSGSGPRGFGDSQPCLSLQSPPLLAASRVEHSGR